MQSDVSANGRACEILLAMEGFATQFKYSRDPQVRAEAHRAWFEALLELSRAGKSADDRAR